jgi:hypothetical protein
MTDEFDFDPRTMHLTLRDDTGLLVGASRVTFGLDTEPSIIQKWTSCNDVPFGSGVAEFSRTVISPVFRRRGLFTFFNCWKLMIAARQGCHIALTEVFAGRGWSRSLLHSLGYEHLSGHEKTYFSEDVPGQCVPVWILKRDLATGLAEIERRWRSVIVSNRIQLPPSVVT